MSEINQLIIFINIYLTKKQTIQIQYNTKYNTSYIRMAQETSRESKCYIKLYQAYGQVMLLFIIVRGRGTHILSGGGGGLCFFLLFLPRPKSVL